MRASLLLLVVGTGLIACASAVAPYAADDASAADAVVPIPTPTARPIAPLSSAYVTSQRPTLHWRLGDGADGVTVLLCRDRALTQACTTTTATGASGAPASPLTPGVWFWQTRARAGAVSAVDPGPVWQFTVGARSAPTDTSWGTVPDFDGDGLADVAVGFPSANGGAGRVEIRNGHPSGASADADVTLTDARGVVAEFGWSVASAGDVDGDGFADLVVGAPNNGGPDGTLHVFRGSAAGIQLASEVAVPAPMLVQHDLFGTTVDGVGDVNGDGYADIAVVASSSATNRNHAYVYFGTAHGISSSPSIDMSIAYEPNTLASISAAGDVNADGYGDFVVGIPVVAPADTSDPARALVILGGVAGPSVSRMIEIDEASAVDASFGFAVTCAGDVNGDGYADVAVGSGDDSATAGAVYVFHGGAMGTSRTPAATLAGAAPGSYFGWSLSSAGDTNADGYADLVVGFSAGPMPTTVWGEASVFLGSADGVVTEPAATLAIGPGEPLGTAGLANPVVAGVGDVNGDGASDIVGLAPEWLIASETLVVTGALFAGSSTGVAATPAMNVRWTLPSFTAVGGLPDCAAASAH